MRRLSAALWVLAAASVAGADERAQPWTRLFNGRDLSGWDTWLGVPHGSTDKVAVGLNVDPKRVFSVVEVDGAPAIRISGETFGALTSREEYGDFHLRVAFKWGEKKWPPRENARRDSGILYYAVGPQGVTNNKAWMRSLECQVQEGDVGDYWGVEGAVVDVTGEKTGEGKDLAVLFKKGAPPVAIDGTPRRAIKAFDNEKPTGSWNTVEVLCLRGTCVHAVNGKVNLVLTHPRQPAADGGTVPITRGRLQIQSEGAEVYYRDIAIRSITAFPEDLKP
jgi:hypothetical protein